MTTTVSGGTTLTVTGYTNLSSGMIFLEGGAVLSVGPKGTVVSAGGDAVYGQFTASPATVINHGIIADADPAAGTGLAVALHSGGVILNYGSIGSWSTFSTNGILINSSGSQSAVQVASILNAGTIAPTAPATSGSAFAVELAASGNTLTNTGLISARDNSTLAISFDGITIAAGSATILNEGTILGSEPHSAYAPIVAGGAAGGVTVINAGTIGATRIESSGTSSASWYTAISFNETAAPASLILEPGQTLIGHVSAALPFGLTLAAGSAGAVGTLSGAIGGTGAQYIGVGTLSLAPGADWTLKSSVAAGVDVSLSSEDTLGLASPSAFAGTLSNLSESDTIVLPGVPYQSSATLSLADDVLTLSNGGSVLARLTLSPATSYSANEFGLEDLNGTLALANTIPCFARGTRIATARGEVPVESLRPDDRLRTPEGDFRPIRWLGVRRVRLADHPDPLALAPVEIAAHAFGPNRPARPLLVSPGHGLFQEGVLIPADHLVNGASVRRRWPAEIEYYHIELDGHGLILSENLPSESYLDTGNRAAFLPLFGTPAPLPPAPCAPLVFGGEAPEGSSIDALSPPCAPLVFGGEALAAARAALRRRFSALGHTPLPPGEALRLRLLLPDGVVLEPLRREERGERLELLFAVPRASPVRLLAPRAVPAETPGGPPDYRELGFAIHALVWENGHRRLGIPLDGPALGLGWHAPESDGKALWRWLAGAGELLLPGAGRLRVTASALPGGVYFATPLPATVPERVDAPLLSPL